MTKSFLDPDYPRRVGAYAAAAAARYGDRLHTWTPLNEPNVSAELCGYKGLWPPYLTGETGFTALTVPLAEGVVATLCFAISFVKYPSDDSLDRAHPGHPRSRVPPPETPDASCSTRLADTSPPSVVWTQRTSGRWCDSTCSRRPGSPALPSSPRHRPFGRVAERARGRIKVGSRGRSRVLRRSGPCAGR